MKTIENKIVAFAKNTLKWRIFAKGKNLPPILLLEKYILRGDSSL